MRFARDSKVTVISGSGFSKASGIPTFRGSDGLWKNYNASQLATPSAFSQNPQLVWDWYKWRIDLVLNAKPNPAHYAIANLEKKGVDMMVLTQNVDDLHERAGSSSVVHLHGKILDAKCTSCGEKFTWDLKLLEKYADLPKCSECDGLLRPDVVWFGESLNPQVLDISITRLGITDVLIVAGTSGVVQPVAQFPLIALRKNPNVEIYEFNLEETPISPIARETILGPVENTIVDFFSV